MTKLNKVLQVFNLFHHAYEKSKLLTEDEIAKRVGWKPSTVRTYHFKKWQNYLVDEHDGCFKVTKKFKELGPEDFVKHMSQKHEKTFR